MNYFQEIRNLFDVWDNSYGYFVEEITACELRLGVKLPEVLRDYYLQFGNNKQINQTQDHLVLPSELEVAKEEEIYYEQNR